MNSEKVIDVIRVDLLERTAPGEFHQAAGLDKFDIEYAMVRTEWGGALPLKMLMDYNPNCCVEITAINDSVFIENVTLVS